MFPGHVLLTELLLDRLKASSPARIISMIAPAYSLVTPQWFNDPNFVQDPTSYTTTQSLAGSKVSVFMYSRHLAKQLEGISEHNFTHYHNFFAVLNYPIVPFLQVPG